MGLPHLLSVLPTIAECEFIALCRWRLESSANLTPALESAMTSCAKVDILRDGLSDVGREEAGPSVKVGLVRHLHDDRPA